MFIKALRSILKKYKGFYKNKKKTTVFLTIAGAGLLIYGSLILFETLQFKFAERKINSVYSQMLEEFPGSEDSSVGGSCAYRSYKFSKGRPVCGYGSGLRFYAPKEGDARSLAKQFDNFVQNVQNEFGVAPLEDKSPVEETSSKGYFSYSFNQYFFELKCNASMSYTDSSGHYSTNGSRLYLQIGLSCGKDSLVEHYSVTGE